MAAITQKQEAENWFQKQILEKLAEVKGLVDESLKLGRQNGEDVRSLRKELGVDGAHGRLPQLEQAVARFDRNQEKDTKALNARIDALNTCIDELQKNEHERRGGKRIISAISSILGGSLGAAILGMIAKAMGLIH